MNPETKIKILIATPLFPPDIGGPATYTKILLRELPKRGIETDYVNFGEIRYLPRGVRHAVYFFKCLARARNVDVIYAQDPVSTGFPAMLAATILHKKFLLKIVGDYAWEIFQGSAGIFVSLENFQRERYDWFTEIRRAVEKFVAKRAVAVVVPSAYLAGIVAGWGVARPKIHIIQNAFGGIMCPLSRDEARAKHNLKGTILFSAGRLVAWKGFGTLIEMMPDLARDIPDVELFIAGDGEEKEVLEFQIRALGLSGHVHLLGRISREALAEYVRGADLFVLNTGYEGLSHQLLEVLALGTPVVTTNIGGNPEVICDNENGFLVRYDDRDGLKKAITRVLRERELRARFVARGLETVQGFTEGRMVNAVAALFKTL